MRYNVPLYFERKNIKISDIFYLTRQNPHTIITLSSGESIATTIPIKELMLYLPEEDFLNISIVAFILLTLMIYPLLHNKICV